MFGRLGSYRPVHYSNPTSERRTMGVRSVLPTADRVPVAPRYSEARTHRYRERFTRRCFVCQIFVRREASGLTDRPVSLVQQCVHNTAAAS
jgi:hypothetical protein